MKILLIILSLFINFNLFSQWQKSMSDNFGIIKTESIQYVRKNNKKVILKKNSVIRILNISEASNEYLCESVIKDYIDAEEAGYEEIETRDTLILKDNQIIVFDSENIPDKYFCILLKPIYERGSNTNKVFWLEYNETDKLCIASYMLVDAIEAWSSTALYTIINNQPIYYLSSQCEDCRYDRIKDIIVIYNSNNAELFNESDYFHDPSSNEISSNNYGRMYISDPHWKINARDYGNNTELVYDKSSKEFSVKIEGNKEIRFSIQNGQFVKNK